MVYDAAGALHVEWGDVARAVPVRIPAVVTVDPRGLPQQPLSVEVQGTVILFFFIKANACPFNPEFDGLKICHYLWFYW